MTGGQDRGFGCRSSIRYVGMVCCDRDRVGSIRRTAAPPRGGGQTSGDHAPGHVRARSRRLPAARVEGTDVPVAQAVVDEGEQRAGHRDGGDVPGPGVRRYRRGSGRATRPRRGLASTAAHRTSVEPCLVIGPRCTVVSDSRVARGQPGPRAQVPRTGEPAHVPDLGDEDRRQGRSHPGMTLERVFDLLCKRVT